MCYTLMLFSLQERSIHCLQKVRMNEIIRPEMYNQEVLHAPVTECAEQLIQHIESIAHHKLTLDTQYTAVPKTSSQQTNNVFFSITEGNDMLDVTIFSDNTFTQKKHTLSADALLAFADDFVFHQHEIDTVSAQDNTEKLSYSTEQEKKVRRQLQILKNLDIIPDTKHVGIPKHTLDRGVLHFRVSHGTSGLIITYYSDETHNEQEIYGTYMIDDFLDVHNNNFVFKTLNTETTPSHNNHKEVSALALQHTLREHKESAYMAQHRLHVQTPYVFVSEDVRTPTYFSIEKTDTLATVTLFADNSFSEINTTLPLVTFLTQHPKADIAPTVPRPQPHHISEKSEIAWSSEVHYKDTEVVNSSKQYTKNTDSSPKDNETKAYIIQKEPEAKGPRDMLLHAKTAEGVIAITEDTLGVTLKPNGSLKQPWNIAQRAKFYMTSTPGQRGLLLFAQKRLILLEKHQSNQENNV